jgi:hypothetical protein
MVTSVSAFEIPQYNNNLNAGNRFVIIPVMTPQKIAESSSALPGIQFGKPFSVLSLAPQRHAKNYFSSSMNFEKTQNTQFSGTVIGVIIDQGTAENIANEFLKKWLSPYNPDDFQLASAQLVANGHGGKEYRFKWTSKPVDIRIQWTITVSVDASTGAITGFGKTGFEISH